MIQAFLHTLRNVFWRSAPWALPALLCSWIYGTTRVADLTLMGDGSSAQWLHLPAAWLILATGITTLQIWPPLHRGPDASSPEPSPLLRLPAGPAHGCLAAWAAALAVATLWLVGLGALGSMGMVQGGAMAPTTSVHRGVAWEVLPDPTETVPQPWSGKDPEGYEEIVAQLDSIPRILHLKQGPTNAPGELVLRFATNRPDMLLDQHSSVSIHWLGEGGATRRIRVPLLDAAGGAAWVVPVPDQGVASFQLELSAPPLSAWGDAPNIALYPTAPVLFREPTGPHAVLNGAIALLAWLPNLAIALGLCALLRLGISRNTAVVVILGVGLVFAIPQELTPTLGALAALGRGHWLPTAPGVPGVWLAQLLPLGLITAACLVGPPRPKRNGGAT